MLSLALVLMLVLSMSVMASASTVTWTDASTGKTYYLTFSKGTTKVYAEVAVTESYITYSGTGYDDVEFPTTFSAETTWKYTGSTTYNTQLIRAIQAENLKTSASADQSDFDSNSVTINSNYAAGRYVPAIAFEGYSGTWTVTVGSGSLDRAIGGLSGTVSYAPTGDCFLALIPVE